MKSSAPTHRILSACLVGLGLFSACTHNVKIMSVPAGAEIKLNGKSLGQTPVLLTERSRPPGSKYELTANLPGYPPIEIKEHDKICPTPANLVMDAFVFGLGYGFCMKDKYVLDFTASAKPVSR